MLLAAHYLTERWKDPFPLFSPENIYSDEGSFMGALSNRHLRFLLKLEEETRQLIDNNWRAVSAIANALLEKDPLTEAYLTDEECQALPEPAA